MKRYAQRYAQRYRKEGMSLPKKNVNAETKSKRVSAKSRHKERQ